MHAYLFFQISKSHLQHRCVRHWWQVVHLPCMQSWLPLRSRTFFSSPQKETPSSRHSASSHQPLATANLLPNFTVSDSLAYFTQQDASMLQHTSGLHFFFFFLWLSNTPLNRHAMLCWLIHHGYLSCPVSSDREWYHWSNVLCLTLRVRGRLWYFYTHPLEKLPDSFP